MGQWPICRRGAEDRHASTPSVCIPTRLASQVPYAQWKAVLAASTPRAEHAARRTLGRQAAQRRMVRYKHRHRHSHAMSLTVFGSRREPVRISTCCQAAEKFHTHGIANKRSTTSEPVQSNPVGVSAVKVISLRPRLTAGSPTWPDQTARRRRTAPRPGTGAPPSTPEASPRASGCGASLLDVKELPQTHTAACF